MRIGAIYKQPNKDRERFFDGIDYERAGFSFFCGSCNNLVVIGLVSFLSDSDQWESNFKEAEVSEIVEVLGLSKVLSFYKAPDKSGPYISTTNCKKCGHNHLVYVGFHEFQPSRYVGTLHGVYEAIT